MGKLFKPDIPEMPAPIIKNITQPSGSGQEEPSAPRPVRMPTESDETIAGAGRRTRAAALRRRGRLSTIMTDQVQNTVGSSGKKLGA